MNPRLAVAAHKKYPMPDDPLYVPVQAGSNGKESIGYARDDGGENISRLNPYLSELTVLYWAWRNLPEDVDALGLVHYRRYFRGSAPVPETKAMVLSMEEAQDLLRSSDVIVPQSRNYYIETLESHYSHTHDPKDLELLREVVKEKAPEYLDALNSHLAKRSGHMFNIFLMKRDLADRYCQFLFPIVEEIYRRSSLEDKSSFDARMPGRLSEFLLDPWLEVNRIAYREAPLEDTEPVDWMKKGTAFLKAKFFKKKYSSSFK